MSNTEKNPHTHVVTQPNARPPMPLDEFRKQLYMAKYEQQIFNYLNKDDKAASKFMSTVIFCVQKNPKLLACERVSLMQSFMSCAEYGLYPSNVAGEAFIVPYKGKAQFQLGYQGLITLLARAGISVRANIVRKNDVFQYEEGLNPVLSHKPDPFATDEKRGEPVGAYAILENTLGQKVVKVMGKEAVMKIKDLSQAKDSEYSPWNSKQDPELWMWRKTVLKQAAKLVPKTEVLQKAIAEDNEDSIIKKHILDAEGPATGKPDHRPQEIGEGEAGNRPIDGAPGSGGRTIEEGVIPPKKTAKEKQQTVDDDIPIIEENGNGTGGADAPQ